MSDVERDERTDEMLRETYGDIEIGSLSYDVAMVLAQVDPIAYRVTVSEYRDSLCSDGDHGDPDTDDELGRCEWCGTPRAEIDGEDLDDGDLDDEARRSGWGPGQ